MPVVIWRTLVEVFVANDPGQKKLTCCSSRYEYIGTPVYKRWHGSTNIFIHWCRRC